MISLYPRVYYHPDDEVFQVLQDQPRYKREPITVTLAILMGVTGVAAGIGTRTAALVKGEMGLTQLHVAIQKDLGALQDTVSKLEESLASLSEVVMQNGRGLDLLSLKEGGLCAALKEECCFYIDHSGAIRDSMQKLKDRLERRKKEHLSAQGWYEGWFTKSPRLMSLLSAIAGSFIILLLILTFGPCILNRLIAFVKERVGAIELMVLRHQYHTLPTEELETHI